MGSASNNIMGRVLVVVSDRAEAERLVQALGRRGMHPIVTSHPEEALESCKESPPDLVIVDDSLPSMSGARFLAELLRVSWAVSSILVCGEDEEAVHEKTEGLGILGSIKDYGDEDGLSRLLERYRSIRQATA